MEDKLRTWLPSFSYKGLIFPPRMEKGIVETTFKKNKKTNHWDSGTAPLQKDHCKQNSAPGAVADLGENTRCPEVPGSPANVRDPGWHDEPSCPQCTALLPPFPSQTLLLQKAQNYFLINPA